MKKNFLKFGASIIAMGCAACLAGILPAASAQGLPKVNATICDTTRNDNTLRVLYWNIQNGMWSDQGNNYDKFVEWVKSYDPDICVWCEAASHVKTGVTETMPQEERYLPDGWPELAARYGHTYTALGGWRDDFPQMVTSKYPIETILKITDTDIPGKPIAHGAAVQAVDVDGERIYFLTLHLRPHAYGLDVPKEDQKASAAAHEGDLYRLYEIEYLLKHIVNDPQYADQDNLLMLGDFNSISPVDNWHYGLADDDLAFAAQSHILDNTDLKDIIAGRFPGQFVASILGGRRIDYIYSSSAMYDKIDKAMTLTDDWTFGVPLKGLSNYCYPSDHFPILVDFKLK